MAVRQWSGPAPDRHARWIDLVQGLGQASSLEDALRLAAEALVVTSRARCAVAAMLDPATGKAVMVAEGLESRAQRALRAEINTPGDGVRWVTLPDGSVISLICMKAADGITFFAGADAAPASAEADAGVCVVLALLHWFAEWRAQRQAERFRRLTEIAHGIAGSLDLDWVLNRIVRDACLACGSRDLTWEPASGRGRVYSCTTVHLQVH